MTPLLVITITLGVIEVVARAIPTVNNWAPLGIIISALNWLSTILNNTKKK